MEQIKLRCNKCAYYDPLNDDKGYCRRESPSVKEVLKEPMTTVDDVYVAVWPVVNSQTDWCGDGDYLDMRVIRK